VKCDLRARRKFRSVEFKNHMYGRFHIAGNSIFCPELGALDESKFLILDLDLNIRGLHDNRIDLEDTTKYVSDRTCVVNGHLVSVVTEKKDQRCPVRQKKVTVYRNGFPVHSTILDTNESTEYASPEFGITSDYLLVEGHRFLRFIVEVAGFPKIRICYPDLRFRFE
jgi:hypothetical protein